MASDRAQSRRGSQRLLWDCATIGYVIERDRPAAIERLIDEVGKDLAAILVQQPQTALPRHEAV